MSNLAAAVRIFLAELFLNSKVIDVSNVQDISKENGTVTLALLINSSTFNEKRPPIDILRDAIRLCEPQAVIFVVPGLFNPLMFGRLMHAFFEISQSVPFFILELPTLDQMGIKQATVCAKKALSSWPGFFTDETPNFLISRNGTP
jgi:hypothetical protein